MDISYLDLDLDIAIANLPTCQMFGYSSLGKISSIRIPNFAIGKSYVRYQRWNLMQPNRRSSLPLAKKNFDP